MSEIDTALAVHDIVLGKFLKRLLTEYKDEQLSDAQLCSLYQECDSSIDIAEILNCSAFEKLP